jgi:hypothetical protein
LFSKAVQIREGVKAPGPICPDALANNIVRLSVARMAAVL